MSEPNPNPHEHEWCPVCGGCLHCTESTKIEKEHPETTKINYEKVHLALYYGKIAGRLWQEERKDEAWDTLIKLRGLMERED